jgi:hypothetical protein
MLIKWSLISCIFKKFTLSMANGQKLIIRYIKDIKNCLKYENTTALFFLQINLGLGYLFHMDC